MVAALLPRRRMQELLIRQRDARIGGAESAFIQPKQLY
jgi:hypothetical protein